MLLYADSQQRRTESNLYAIFGFIYTMFCLLTAIDSSYMKTFLSCFPQKELRAKQKQDENKDAERDSWRIPDFCAFILQGILGNKGEKFGGRLAFILEIKSGALRHRWRTTGNKRMTPTGGLHGEFLKHMPQILEQARYAYQGITKNQKHTVRAFLIVDVWFAYFEFYSKPDSLEGQVDHLPKKEREARLYDTLKEHCIQSPQRIFTEDWSSFNPCFLQTLSQALNGHEGFEMSPDEIFQAPEGSTVESASALINKELFLKEAKDWAADLKVNNQKLREVEDDTEQELSVPGSSTEGQEKETEKGKGKGKNNSKSKGKGKKKDDDSTYESNLKPDDYSFLGPSPAKRRPRSQPSGQRRRARSLSPSERAAGRT